MTFDVNLVGGGFIKLQLDADDLHEVSERLRRERGLIGHMIAADREFAVMGQVLIPAQRIALISEA